MKLFDNISGLSPDDPLRVEEVLLLFPNTLHHDLAYFHCSDQFWAAPSQMWPELFESLRDNCLVLPDTPLILILVSPLKKQLMEDDEKENQDTFEISLLHVWRWCVVSSLREIVVREAPAQEKHGSNGLCPNSVSTPPPQANGRFVGAIFAENLSIF